MIKKLARKLICWVLAAVLTPISAPKITYRSSNKKVAAVSGKGLITAKKNGKAVITVKSGTRTLKVKVTIV